MEPTTFRTSFPPECPCLNQYRTSKAILILIEQVFHRFAPDRLGKVKDLVRAHPGREPALYLKTLEIFASGSEPPKPRTGPCMDPGIRIGSRPIRIPR
jgi:hypothetical protein